MAARFFNWLVEQVDRPDPVGDLARDALRDPTAPITGNCEVWRSYLARHPGAGSPARAALEQAIQEFRRP
jgi:hypothetical protein